jgi:hypothetical protein
MARWRRGVGEKMRERGAWRRGAAGAVRMLAGACLASLAAVCAVEDIARPLLSVPVGMGFLPTEWVRPMDHAFSALAALRSTAGDALLGCGAPGSDVLGSASGWMHVLAVQTNRSASQRATDDDGTVEWSASSSVLEPWGLLETGSAANVTLGRLRSENEFGASIAASALFEVPADDAALQTQVEVVEGVGRRAQRPVHAFVGAPGDGNGRRIGAGAVLLLSMAPGGREMEVVGRVDVDACRGGLGGRIFDFDRFGAALTATRDAAWPRGLQTLWVGAPGGCDLRSDASWTPPVALFASAGPTAPSPPPPPRWWRGEGAEPREEADRVGWGCVYGVDIAADGVVEGVSVLEAPDEVAEAGAGFGAALAVVGGVTGGVVRLAVGAPGGYVAPRPLDSDSRAGEVAGSAFATGAAPDRRARGWGGVALLEVERDGSWLREDTCESFNAATKVWEASRTVWVVRNDTFPALVASLGPGHAALGAALATWQDNGGEWVLAAGAPDCDSVGRRSTLRAAGCVVFFALGEEGEAVLGFSVLRPTRLQLLADAAPPFQLQQEMAVRRELPAWEEELGRRLGVAWGLFGASVAVAGQIPSAGAVVVAVGAPGGGQWVTERGAAFVSVQHWRRDWYATNGTDAETSFTSACDVLAAPSLPWTRNGPAGVVGAQVVTASSLGSVAQGAEMGAKFGSAVACAEIDNDLSTIELIIGAPGDSLGSRSNADSGGPRDGAPAGAAHVLSFDTESLARADPILRWRSRLGPADDFQLLRALVEDGGT